MKRIEITFDIKKQEKITIEIEHIREIHCCYELPIFFIKDNTKIILSIDSIRENMQIFKDQLNNTLSNNLQLHESLKGADIGFLYNQYLQKKPGLFYKKFEKVNYWIGINYIVWATNEYVTWLYNDEEASIILEITPAYPKKKNVEQNKQMEPYSKWIKNYSPYLIRKISTETAQEWLAQIDSILKTIEENVRGFESQA